MRKVFIWILFFVFIVGFVLYKQQSSAQLAVTFLDVGQGDGIHIRTHNGFDMIVDTGPDFFMLHALGKSMPFYDKDIEMMMISHPHADHIAGGIEIMRRYHVGHIMISGNVAYSPVYNAFMEEVAKQHIPVTYARAGQVFTFDTIQVKILFPFTDADVVDTLDPNDTSIIAQLFYGKNSFLFTGDAGVAIEDRLVRSGVDLRSDVLKVGHHGSETSTGRQFLETVHPAIGVIQSGTDNTFGHPRQETLDTLNAFGVRILRNDQMGNIRMECDQEVCHVE